MAVISLIKNNLDLKAQGLEWSQPSVFERLKWLGLNMVRDQFLSTFRGVASSPKQPDSLLAPKPRAKHHHSYGGHTADGYLIVVHLYDY